MFFETSPLLHQFSPTFGRLNYALNPSSQVNTVQRVLHGSVTHISRTRPSLLPSWLVCLPATPFHTSWRADTRTRWQHFQEGNVSLHFQTLTLTLVVWFPHPLLNIYFFNSTSLQTSTELQILHWQCTSAHESPSIAKNYIHHSFSLPLAYPSSPYRAAKRGEGKLLRDDDGRLLWPVS